MRYNFKDSVGKEVTFIGIRSKIPWQHLIQFFSDRKHIDYLDLDNGEQIVIYSREPITCRAKMRITGELIVTKGKSKRLGAEENDTYIEYQLLVDSWTCED